MTWQPGAAAVLVVVGVVAAGVWLVSQPAHEGDAPHARLEAPDFSLTDVDGTTRTLSAFRGRVVLLNFWATYCTGCKIEMPWFVEFHHRYSAHGLEVVAVAIDDSLETLHPYLQQHPVPFPVVVGDAQTARAYNLSALPLTLLLDRDGRIAASHLGIVDRDDWERRIRELLGPATPPAGR